jgi:hypothetical protein
MQNLFVFSAQSKNINIKIYKTIILSVILYRREAWSLTLRKENRLRVFENRVLRKIFGPKRDEVTGEWRRLHNEELHDPYSPPNTYYSTVIRTGQVACLGDNTGACRVSVRKPAEIDHLEDLGIDRRILLQ